MAEVGNGDPAAAERLRLEGNQATGQGQYAEAEAKYSQAIALLADPALADSSGTNIHTLYGNRALVRMHLEKHSDALADADAAVALAPTWAKGFYRKACAHQALGQAAEAHAAFLTALALEPDNALVKKKTVEAQAELARRCGEEAARDEAEFRAAFAALPDARRRLHCLAHLWNLCAPDERHAIFARFLQAATPLAADDADARRAPRDAQVVSSAGDQPHTGVHAEDFPPESLSALPMDNYTDLPPAPGREAFWAALDTPRRVAVFEGAWRAIDQDERDCISNDLAHFFLRPLLAARAAAGAAAAARAAADGDADGDGDAADDARGGGVDAAAGSSGPEGGSAEGDSGNQGSAPVDSGVGSGSAVVDCGGGSGNGGSGANGDARDASSGGGAIYTCIASADCAAAALSEAGGLRRGGMRHQWWQRLVTVALVKRE
ncbi:hypothetical protein JKP88DRAFT_262840 [Tribonema minus]|uniref:Uncharacterized protein n=1 Tax=Tribonema minus TaxID=303371 RepID=A0A835Z8N5_9STRA|nr:hypothetical protein JKP88DRAFT_262840 [Tribonema minus]